MNIRRKRRCPWCSSLFVPNPRLKGRQKTCGSERCKRRQNLLAQRRWKRKWPIVYRQEQSDWRKTQKEDEKEYWKDWRKEHSEYVVRNRILTRLRVYFFRHRVCLQRKLDIAQLFKKQVKFRRYCGLQRKLDRLFRYPSFISLPHERVQGQQKSGAP